MKKITAEYRTAQTGKPSFHFQKEGFFASFCGVILEVNALSSVGASYL